LLQNSKTAKPQKNSLQVYFNAASPKIYPTTLNTIPAKSDNFMTVPKLPHYRLIFINHATVVFHSVQFKQLKFRMIDTPSVQFIIKSIKDAA
jgi:hypothetical protein